MQFRIEQLTDRARGSLVGLAIGDALGRPAEGSSPAQIREMWGRITGFLDDEPVGSDDTEYALFSAGLLIKYGKEIRSTDVAAAWRTHIASQTGGFRGAGFSELATIINLRRGVDPPLSGAHNHGWSDGLAMRVAPFGVAAAGQPKLAAHLAAIDGSVSHSGEGIYSGQAVAAAVAMAMTGADVDQVISAALSVIPDDSWTYRAIQRAAEIGQNAADVWGALEPLYHSLACTYYHWTDLGPEAVGLAFGVIVASRGDFVDSVLGGVNVGRDTDTIAAIAGGIVGARTGLSNIPSEWASRLQATKGICIHTVAGVDLRQTADQLAGLAEKWSQERVEAFPTAIPTTDTTTDIVATDTLAIDTPTIGPIDSTISEIDLKQIPSLRKDRVSGALLGLAIGDTLSWPALYHRSWPLPAWTRRLRREIESASETTKAIRPPMPFSLNRPPESFDLGPTDDTEWLAFTGQMLIESNGTLSRDQVRAAWIRLLQDNSEIRGGISTQAALHNLRMGLNPPITGHDNPHYFDDGACPRAVAIGAFCGGDPDKAAELAAIDAEVTNSLDGLWAAQAIAASIAVICGGGTITEAIGVARSVLPTASWIHHTVEWAMELCDAGNSLFERLPILIDGIVNREYSYGIGAPESLAITLSIVRLAKGDLLLGVSAATAVAKVADSVPALVGAILGGLSGGEAIPSSWIQRVATLKGVCIPSLAGFDYSRMVQQLAVL